METSGDRLGAGPIRGVHCNALTRVFLARHAWQELDGFPQLDTYVSRVTLYRKAAHAICEGYFEFLQMSLTRPSLAA